MLQHRQNLRLLARATTIATSGLMNDLPVELESQYLLFIVTSTDETAADLTRASKLQFFAIIAEN